MALYCPDINALSYQEKVEFLKEKAEHYEDRRFLEEDPIQLPHRFSDPLDIEICGFLVALISWGQRKSIIQSGLRLMALMEWDPFRFVSEATDTNLRSIDSFVHRTLNGEDLRMLILGLRKLYDEKGGLAGFFSVHQGPTDVQEAISRLKYTLFDGQVPLRTRKHLADPGQGSAAKRINMFLRWMVRPATRGVDFGLWTDISPSKLSCPLDVHSGKVARSLGLLTRSQNDARAVAELDQTLREIDSADPVRFDFALFGLGAYERFGS